MVDFNRAIFITERIEECYLAAKRLFGGNFDERTEPIRVAMQMLKDKTKCSTVAAGQAVMEMLKRRGDLDAMGIMMVSAVIYAMSEESEVV